jgi:hypothetical protein
MEGDVRLSTPNGDCDGDRFEKALETDKASQLDIRVVCTESINK